jgi:hypothetical protein
MFLVNSITTVAILNYSLSLGRGSLLILKIMHPFFFHLSIEAGKSKNNSALSAPVGKT